MASIFQRGNTPRPGDPIRARDFGALADASTSAKTQIYGSNSAGILTPGGVIIVPPAQYRPTTKLHNYSVYNASDGTTPAIRVTPGNHIDSTGGGTIWVPTIDGVPIAPLPDPPDLPPSLNVEVTHKVVFFKFTVNEIDGTGASPPAAITASEINSAVTVPANDNTTIYQPCAFITVTVGDTYARVVSNEGGVQASQVYQFCSGPLFGPQ